ncbi:integrator complex subunit 2-like [Lingula anatina]|uniref:Integrator complex subunit 2-like n=1 Tax=Lingula anatina TaxID=7574 RepID=A0A1S3IYX9_LINAN|nr:integrator complex subunit 2-like [Lingula anatina]|eukprot:XP_013403191.1 integrator complex subunit 2-like [Lingula anatina]
MAALDVVSPSTFKALQNLDIECLAYLSENELRPILPCLVRMSLCAPSDNGERWMESKKSLLRILSGIEVVNSVVQLLSVDFHELEIDAKKEQHLRTKAGSSQSESMLISQLQNSLSLEFERADAPRRLRLVLSELLFVVSQMRETRTEFYHKPSELFECDVYLEEVADVICIAQAELPRLLPVTEVAEAMLHVKNGHLILCRLVANLPESFSEGKEILSSKL